MNFDYSEEQQLLADSVRRYLAKSYDFESRKKIVAGEGWSAQAWAQLAEMGLTGLAVPAEHGGFGGGAVDLMGVMEAFGEALVVEPYVPTVLAARLVARAGSAAQKQAILPAVAEGRMKLALAHVEKGARYRLESVHVSFDHGRLKGEKAAVIGAPVADKIVVSARGADGIGLYLVDRPRAKPYRTLDERLAADLVFRDAPAEKLQGGLELVEEAFDFGAALACAEAVGAMKFACDTTLEYLKTRKQFGAPIGTFQALQHRIVDLYIEYEQAKSMACLACSKADQAESARERGEEGARERARAVSSAKIKIGDAARRISQESLQLHGGMGMSEELKISHTFRRLTALAREFGDVDVHLARFAAL
jgi:alkylation response protein AidB-like acyl-CoA dehydrogenase